MTSGIMKLIAVIFSLFLGVDAMAENVATIHLERVNSTSGQKQPEAGSYLLKFKAAYVTQGSYSGIKMTFRREIESPNYDELTLFIPSHDQFEINYFGYGGEFVSSIPETPFTFHAKRTVDIQDRHGRSRPMKIELTRWLKRGKDSWSTRSIEFTDCEIDVDSMEIEAHKINFQGGFKCEARKLEYMASGDFSVVEGDLGVSKVD